MGFSRSSKYTLILDGIKDEGMRGGVQWCIEGMMHRIRFHPFHSHLILILNQIEGFVHTFRSSTVTVSVVVAVLDAYAEC